MITNEEQAKNIQRRKRGNPVHEKKKIGSPSGDGDFFAKNII